MRSSIIDTQRVPSGKVRDPHLDPVFNPYVPYPEPSRPRSPKHRTPQRPLHNLVLAPSEGWFSLVLLAIALYSVVFSIIAANWVGHSFLIIWGPALGLVTGFLVAKISRIPQTFLHLAACLIGHWFAIWLTCSVAFNVNWTVLLAALRSAFTGATSSGVLPSSEIVFFFYLTFLCFFLGYFGCWLVYRAHLPWLVALVYSSIMLVNLNYVQRDLLYLLIIMIGALILLIARVQLVAQVMQWKRDGLYTDRVWMRGMTRRLMQVAIVLMLITLLVGWLLPVQQQSSEGKALWDAIDNATINITNGHISLNDPTAVILPYQAPTNFFGDQMTIAGSVHLPVGEVLSYTSSSGAQYLEGFTYDSFDGHTWKTSLSDADKQIFVANDQLADDTRSDFNGVTTKITVQQPPEGTKNYIFGPAQPVSFDVPVSVYSDGTAVSWVKSSPLTKGEIYQVTSHVPPSDAQSLGGIPLPADDRGMWVEDGNYKELVNNYVQLPSDLSPNVKKTTLTWTKGATDAYSALKMLESHLNNTQGFTYSIDNPPVPGNIDVVDWLLQTRKGYCTYYASAMTIMARELAIPTRVVNGFSQGHFDTQRQAWVVDGTDAHSWVQSYLPGFGWISFDPTPGYAPNAVPGTPTKPAPVATQAPSRPIPAATPPIKKPKLPSTTSHQDPRPLGGHGNPLANQGVLMFISLGVLFLSFLFMLISLVRYWWRNLYVNNSVTERIFLRMCRVASWVGLAPKAWQTPYEYSTALSRHIPQRQQQSLWRVTELYVRDRWGQPHQRVSLKEEDAERLWFDLRGALLGKAFRKIKR